MLSLGYEPLKDEAIPEMLTFHKYLQDWLDSNWQKHTYSIYLKLLKKEKKSPILCLADLSNVLSHFLILCRCMVLTCPESQAFIDFSKAQELVSSWGARLC